MKTIRILKCSDSFYWYRDSIGFILSYDKEDEDRYWTRDYGGYRNFILKIDAEEVAAPRNEKSTFMADPPSIFPKITPTLEDELILIDMPVQTPPQPMPGTKYDGDKLKYTLIPPYALQAVAKNLTEGLKKYPERDNWMKVPEARQRYADALYRHMEAHRRGELYDTESSDPTMLHLAAVAVNALFLLEFELNPNLKEIK